MNPEKPKIKMFEVIDVEEAYAYFTSNKENVKDYKAAIELLGHRVLVREVRT